MFALIPVVLAGTVDPASSIMVLVAAAIFLLAVVALTRPWPGPARSAPSGEAGGEDEDAPADTGRR